MSLTVILEFPVSLTVHKMHPPKLTPCVINLSATCLHLNLIIASMMLATCETQPRYHEC